MEENIKWSVSSMVIDNYDGKRNIPHEVLNPTLVEISEAIKSLNGGSRSSLCINGSDTSVMSIGGGPTLYHLSVTLPDKVLILCDQSKSDEQVDMIIGSIRTPLPANFTVPPQMVMVAINEFFLHGSLASSQHWVEC